MGLFQPPTGNEVNSITHTNHLTIFFSLNVAANPKQDEVSPTERKTAKVASQTGTRLVFPALFSMLTGSLVSQEQKTVTFAYPGTFPFLKLPPELRNAIYRLCLVSTNRHGDLAPCGLYQPAITRACKTTRRETLAIFYTENIFTMDIHQRDPAMEPPKEEHERFKFLRGLKLLTESAYFPQIRDLEIVTTIYCDDEEIERGEMDFAVRIFKDGRHLETEEECTPAYDEEMEELSVLSQVDSLPERDYRPLGPTDWSNIDLVHQEVEGELLIYGHEFALDRAYGEAFLLENARVGRLCEVLSILLGPCGEEIEVFS